MYCNLARDYSRTYDLNTSGVGLGANVELRSVKLAKNDVANVRFKVDRVGNVSKPGARKI